MEPKVSVIIPIYNVEDYLRACIESALNQTLREIEVILLDDGSTDTSPAIIDYYAKQDERVVAIHKPNEGYGRTCNRGFDMARGEYIAILESDDFVESTMYEDLYACAIRLDADVVKSPYLDCFADGEMKPYPFHRWLSDHMPCNRLYSLRDCPDQLAVHQSIWAGIYKRSYMIQNHIRFDEVPGAGHVDIKFCVESLIYSDRLAWVDMPYYRYRVLREDSSTATFSVTENAERYRQMHDFFKDFPETFLIAQKALVAREGVGLYRYYKRSNFDHDDFRMLRSLLLDFDDENIKNAPLITSAEKEELLLCKHNPDSAFALLSNERSESQNSSRVLSGGIAGVLKYLMDGSKGFDWFLKLFVFGVMSLILLGFIAAAFPTSAPVITAISFFFLLFSACAALASTGILLLKIARGIKRHMKGRVS